MSPVRLASEALSSCLRRGIELGLSSLLVLCLWSRVSADMCGRGFCRLDTTDFLKALTHLCFHLLLRCHKFYSLKKKKLLFVGIIRFFLELLSLSSLRMITSLFSTSQTKSLMLKWKSIHRFLYHPCCDICVFFLNIHIFKIKLSLSESLSFFYTYSWKQLWNSINLLQHMTVQNSFSIQAQFIFILIKNWCQWIFIGFINKDVFKLDIIEKKSYLLYA